MARLIAIHPVPDAAGQAQTIGRGEGHDICVFDETPEGDAPVVDQETRVEHTDTTAAAWHQAYQRLLAEYRAIRAEMEALRTAVVGVERLLGSLAEGPFHANVRRAAASEATVLVLGETGTGKELVAREVHRLSPRAGERFVTVNCAALAAARLLGIDRSTLYDKLKAHGLRG
ncbi:MAG: sigma 54-interacting transcriptional regulator [bacterium]